MASILPSSLFVGIFIFSISNLIFVSESRAPFKPNTLVLPVVKDNTTNLHITNIQKGTPLSPTSFVVDLNGRFSWVNCDQNYSSSTYHAPFCHSTQCSRIGTHYCLKCTAPKPQPGCHNNTCGVIATNPITHTRAMSELAQDVIAIQSAPNSTAGPITRIRQFVFACSPSNMLQGLGQNVHGIVGLGHNPIALPTQLASHFGFRPKFAMCLSPSNKGNGVIFFGDPPYKFHPNIDFSVPFTKSTPLTVSSQGEYFIQVTSIRVSFKPLKFNTSSFQRTKQGGIYSMISTTTPYTTLEHSIFNAFSQIFSTQLPRVDQVAPVSPFGFCVNTNNLTQVPRPGGFGAPIVDFHFSNPNATWAIFGANSWIQAKPGVSCLAFVDGGVNPRAPIVFGLHQMENYLIQFDLARSRLGFSSSLLFSRTTCDSFNFTSHA